MENLRSVLCLLGGVVIVLFTLFGCGKNEYENVPPERLSDAIAKKGAEDSAPAKQGSETADKNVVKKGSKVKVYYKGSLEDGTVFDESKPDMPLEFVVGSGQMIAGFDKGVVGLKLNEETRIKIAPEEGYGNYRPDLVMDVPRSSFSEGFDLEEGMTIGLQDGTGRPMPAKVVEIGTESVKIDLNHKLAGKKLIFDLKVLEIK